MAKIHYHEKGVMLSVAVKQILGILPTSLITHKLGDNVKLPSQYSYVTEIRKNKISQFTCQHILVDGRGGMGDGYNCISCGYQFYDNESVVRRAARNGRLIECERLSDPDDQTPVYLLVKVLEVRGRQLSGLL